MTEVAAAAITMFFLKELSLTMTLHPSYFGPRMRSYLRQKLLADVEGTCSGQYGYIVCVLDSNKLDIGDGNIIPGQGTAEFVVKYQAIVWKPFKGEVLDAVVVTVNKMGFFAYVGPLSVFVSSHLIPSDMKYDPNANPPNYSGDDQVIEKGAKVRLKIVGIRTDATEIVYHSFPSPIFLYPDYPLIDSLPSSLIRFFRTNGLLSPPTPLTLLPLSVPINLIMLLFSIAPCLTLFSLRLRQ